MDAIKAKEVAIYWLAVEVHALSESLGLSMDRCIEEPLTAEEIIEQLEKAKEHFENMLAQIEKFDAADFDALIKVAMPKA